VTVALWRIATDALGYSSDDLSGEGARRTGGRWNSKGRPMIYASSTIALSCLETLVHLNAGGLPLNRYLVRIDAPDDAWTARAIETQTSLRVGWDAVPCGHVSVATGDSWLTSVATLLLEVPSVVVPEETNILINPAHPDAKRLQATKIRRWTYDPRTRLEVA
jgi:RES domain-containing protein